MNRWLDLRLVIGLFFSVIGVLLIIHWIGQADRGQATVNGWCGAGFLLFGGLMMGMSLLTSEQDQEFPRAGRESSEWP